MSDSNLYRNIALARRQFGQATVRPISPGRRPEGRTVLPPRMKAANQNHGQRVDRTVERLRQHCLRNKTLWIGRETVKLIAERIKPAPVLTPRGMRKGISLPAINRQARQNVEARITQRLSRVDAMRGAPKQTRDLSQPRLKQAWTRTQRR